MDQQLLVKTMKLTLLLLGAISACWMPAEAADLQLAGKPASTRLTLPPVIYAVPGVEMNLYFANTVPAGATEHLSFTVRCGIGSQDAVRWKLNATANQIGKHPLTLEMRQASGQPVGRCTTQVQVVPASAGQGREITLLIVGDSLTNATHYPNELARLLSTPGNPKWQMLGTNKPSWAAPNVAHEGYGGWTWRAFNSRFDSTPPPPGKRNTSPFVLAEDPRKPPKLDLPRYFVECCGGRVPDYVTFLLGINDCFGLKSSDPKGLEAGITSMLEEADKLLAAFHQAAPHAELGVCLTTPPNIREAAFVANYKDTRPRSNWCQTQHRLVERQIEHFQNREREGIFLIPTEINLDITGGYPDNNAVHPNPSGYQQIGATIYSWLKARMAASTAGKGQ